MVTHMHPLGSLSEFSGIPGSNATAKAIKKFKPDLLIYGHIHEAAGIDEFINGTRVINVGRNGTIIEIDIKILRVGRSLLVSPEYLEQQGITASGFNRELGSQALKKTSILSLLFRI